MTALDLLGDWKRTHYAGDLRAADADKEVVLMGWVHRRRDLGNLIFIDLRARGGIPQIVFNKELVAAAHARAEELRSEYVVAVRGKVARRARPNPELPSGEVEGVASALHILNTAKTPQAPAVRGGRRGARGRRDAPALSLSGPAAAATAAQSGAAASHRAGDAQDARRAGLLRNRDAHADALHARRRARLPGAQPRPPRPFLRAAAVAANVQADSHDRRGRQKFFDCPPFSRRRHALPPPPP